MHTYIQHQYTQLYTHIPTYILACIHARYLMGLRVLILGIQASYPLLPLPP